MGKETVVVNVKGGFLFKGAWCKGSLLQLISPSTTTVRMSANNKIANQDAFCGHTL